MSRLIWEREQEGPAAGGISTGRGAEVLFCMNKKSVPSIGGTITVRDMPKYGHRPAGQNSSHRCSLPLLRYPPCPEQRVFYVLILNSNFEETVQSVLQARLHELHFSYGSNKRTYDLGNTMAYFYAYQMHRDLRQIKNLLIGGKKRDDLISQSFHFGIYSQTKNGKMKPPPELFG